MSEIPKSSSRKFTCDICNKDFANKPNLQRHVNSVHVKVKINCEFCNYRSTTKSNLKKHINTVHLKLKPFQCDECDYSCGQSGTLKTHVDSVHKKFVVIARLMVVINRFLAWQIFQRISNYMKDK